MGEYKSPSISVTSATLVDGNYIPQKYHSDHLNIHPPFSFRGLPLETASLAMTFEKVDESEEVFDQWVIWNMPPTAAIAEGAARGVVGKNGRGENSYLGPHKPFGHHYRLQVYALNKMLELDEGSGKEELKNAIEGHVLAVGSMHALSIHEAVNTSY